MTTMYSEQCIRPSLNVLGKVQIERIHRATLELLERTGARITHEKVRELLDGAGCRVEGSRVRFPARVVEEALSVSPSGFAMGGRNGEPAFRLEEGESWFGAGLDCMEYIDPLTDDRRLFTSEDCRVTATIANALPNYSWAMTLGFAADAPPEIADRVVARQALTHCEKPLVICCNDLNGLRAIYDMAVLVSGGEERFRRAPLIAHLSSPLSPLAYYDDLVDKVLFCAEKGIPQIFYPGLQAGATSPATFAGTILQGSAESLVGVVIAQLARKGAPGIYGGFTTIMDMTSAIFSYGAPEMTLMTAAMAELARFYDLPFFGSAGCSDAKFPDDPQAAVEGTFSCLSSALSGADMVHDLGLLDHSAVVSPDYMVLVDEVLSMVHQFMRGIPVDDETLALDLIDRVGPGGHYLEEDHTMRHFRDVWYSKLFDRTNCDDWIKGGVKYFSQRLREKTRETMKRETEPLAPEIIKEMKKRETLWR